MKNERLILDYSKLSDIGLNQKAFNVKNCLTNNLNFPTTVPPLADFTVLQEAFDEGITKSVSGDRVQIALKNQAKENLISAMRQLALNINGQANGDKAKLISSGFDLISNSEQSNVITAPTDFKMTEGLSAGEVKFSLSGVTNAISYLFEYTYSLPGEDTLWTSAVSSTRKYTFKGLISGMRIYGRVRVIGRKGQEIISETLSKLVQ